MYHFFIWRDIIEVLFFATLVYYIALWLKKDRQKNLLPYFFGYCLVFLFSWAIQLSTITLLLFIYTPAALMLFILIHQETLQRNLVALKNRAPSYSSRDNWLETLLRSCLVAINHNKEITCVIEYQDQLQEFIHKSLLVNADLREGILELLLKSPSYEHKKMIWVDTKGRLRAINATWQISQNETIDPRAWKDDAILYSSKTDALIFHINPVTRLFTIIVHGKQFDNITAHHTLQLIKKHITSIKQTDSKGECHETSDQHHYSKQHAP